LGGSVAGIEGRAVRESTGPATHFLTQFTTILHLLPPLPIYKLENQAISFLRK